MAAAEQKTNLETPPEYRGGQSAEAYCQAVARWALRYHLTLNPILQTAMQLRADIDDLGQLSQTISNPPTQAEVQAVQDKLNAVIAAAAD